MRRPLQGRSGEVQGAGSSVSRTRYVILTNDENVLGGLYWDSHVRERPGVVIDPTRGHLKAQRHFKVKRSREVARDRVVPGGHEATDAQGVEEGPRPKSGTGRLARGKGVRNRTACLSDYRFRRGDMHRADVVRPRRQRAREADVAARRYGPR